MSQVKIKVGPKTYTIQCGPDDEEKVAALGEIIDDKYAQLGQALSVQETDNLVFTALFLADELEEARKLGGSASEQVDAARKDADAAKADADKARGEADVRIASAIEAAQAESEREKEKAEAKKDELRSEIETLRKAEERAREESQQLKAELAEMREAAKHQHDMFNSDSASDAVADKLEALATQAEAAAAAMDASKGNAASLDADA